jgi:hypothetical protein
MSEVREATLPEDGMVAVQATTTVVIQPAEEVAVHRMSGLEALISVIAFWLPAAAEAHALCIPGPTRTLLPEKVVEVQAQRPVRLTMVPPIVPEVVVEHNLQEVREEREIPRVQLVLSDQVERDIRVVIRWEEVVVPDIMAEAVVAIKAVVPTLPLPEGEAQVTSVAYPPVICKLG